MKPFTKFGLGHSDWGFSLLNETLFWWKRQCWKIASKGTLPFISMIRSAVLLSFLLKTYNLVISIATFSYTFEGGSVWLFAKVFPACLSFIGSQSLLFRCRILWHLNLFSQIRLPSGQIKITSYFNFFYCEELKGIAYSPLDKSLLAMRS